ncbi:MAG: acetyl-CoA carboxylase biotin carboxyl carrier protein [Flavitalea sp.]
MDFKQIQELIKMINKSNIGEVSIEEKGFKLTIKQKEEAVQHLYSSAAPAQSYGAQLPPASAPNGSSAVSDKSKATADTPDNLITIKSPMIGTFYRSSTPGKPPFVEIGDEVTTGKVVCIIEAMKLFNEIESEVKGRIVKMLVDDASPVEYDQPLFLVDPS